MADKKIAVLKTRRDRFLARIQITHQLIPFINTDEKKRETFLSRYEKVSEWLGEIESFHNDIENLLIESDKASDCAEIATISLQLDEMVFEISSAKRQQNSNIKSEPISANSIGNLKLPAIQITPFDSNVKNWHTFHALFENLIHNNNMYTDIEKFHHLISLLKGTALNLVKSLPLIAENYPIAWNILLQKYEDSRLLFTFYVDEMMNFKPLPNESINGLTHLLNTFQENLSALNAMKHENIFSKFVAHIILRCLDQDTRRQFETSLTRTQLPETSQLFEFLHNQIRILEASNPLTTNIPKPKTAVARKSLLAANSSSELCAICKESHSIYKCGKFLEMSPLERKNRIKHLNRCFNCLKFHRFGDCQSQSSCKICNKRHHSMLHFETPSTGEKVTTSLTAVTKSNENVSNAPNVLLGTAIVHMQNKFGAYAPVRIIVDNGSQVSIITQSCAKRLGLSIRKYKTPLNGLGQTTVNSCTGITSCVIKPVKQRAPMLSATPIVIQEITSWMPYVTLDKDVKSRFLNLSLADPSFDQPGQIDFLLGADLYPNILDDQSHIVRGNPSALNTVFGYIILGKVGCQSIDSSPTSLMTLSDMSLNDTMKNFWEIEEAPVVSDLNPDNTKAEEIFQKEHYRQTDGRYVVPILLKSDSPPPQNTYNLAESRMRKLEKRFDRDATLATSYRDFLHEYESLSHMKRVAPNSGANYLPHHAVINGKGKIRVVFDGSAKASDMSLNDMLYSGPKLQTEIPYMILNFRFHQFVFTADICKMYRQILIIPNHRKYQHILWRDSPSEPMKDYELQTITYGLTSSPFLAISTLRQLARDEKESYPAASRALLENFYVDDLATGADSIESARHLKEEIVAVLKSAKLELSKWASNCSELLEHDSECQQQQLNFNKTQSNVKILGVFWNPEEDYFSYHISIPNSAICSKRNILSTLARIYDPLGWLSPVIFTAKRIIQELWKLNVDWDTEVPLHIMSTWNNFVEQLPLLQQLRIPRYYHTNLDSHCILVGFCDASQLGYAAVTYLVVQNHNSSHLLMAKSKVAPLKSLTIPRLELCAAVLLSKLIKYILSSVHFAAQIEKVILFTDSTIVLSWLQTPPHLLKTFVANRVVQILDNTPKAIWKHVISEDNSADYGSRGTLPVHFVKHLSWLSGPPWLRNPVEDWPSARLPFIPASELPEIQPPKPAVFNVELKSSSIIAKYSSLSKLKKVIAWILRFKTNCLSNVSKMAKQSIDHAALTLQELDNAFMKIIKLEQQAYLHNDIILLSSDKMCSSGLQKLKPFIDSHGILRVGGRLTNSALPSDSKHPILLPKSSHLTGLLIDYYHRAYLHVGPRTLQFLIQRKYWIMSGRTVIRSQLSKCVTCHKFRAIAHSPMMADLPSSRVQPSRPFSRVGVDFGGPFMLKDHKRRGAKTTKAYLCLFVCMATKALHLEVVSDLSTDAFIASLTRFINRRGLCSEVFSDCGTNFVGAKRYLTGVFKYFYSSPQREVISDYLAQKEILWTFNPPASPHFGGLWESGIKSVKHHLVRVVGDTSLTFEEFATLLTTIEAILNSRPLCPLSVDPENVDALTPGHFLIGGFLLGLPEYDLSATGSNRLSRWQHIQKMSQHFWRRWNVEYLNTLQQRAKWLRDRPNLEIGQLVLVKDERLPPMRWALGRIVAVHPGKDNIVRVATIKTTKGIFVRPAVKLCPLPIE